MQRKLVTDPIIESISLDAPWRLVEAFSRMPRWRPKDVDRGAGLIVKMLRDNGVPVTVHTPTVYLSIPFAAEVRVGDQVMKAKPPAYSRDCRNGIEGELVHVPASYSRSVGTLFARTDDAAQSTRERLAGKIVVSEASAFRQKCWSSSARVRSARSPSIRAPTRTGASAHRSGARRISTIFPASQPFRSRPSTMPMALR
jgi:hypothetical protein